VSEVNCPDCGVEPDQWHGPGCDIEQCPCCGGQAVCCDSEADPIPLGDRLPWTGLWPGEAEAIQHRWYSKLTPAGWWSCPPDATGAMPDLNRVRREMTWDRDEKCFVRKHSNSRSA
jgi:hypothetical protein